MYWYLNIIVFAGCVDVVSQTVSKLNKNNVILCNIKYIIPEEGQALRHATRY